MSKVSSKVQKLIEILNAFSSQTLRVKQEKKVIVFVKDRDVAVYLNKFLKLQVKLSQNLDS